MTLLADLQQQIASGQAILIVGAGVSIQATGNHRCASWTGLLHHGAARCAELQPILKGAWLQRVKEEIDSADLDDMLSAAEKIQRKLAAGEYRRWLRESVGEMKVTHREVLEALSGLNVPIATTNYDGLIEEVTRLRPVTWQDGPNVERVLRGDDKCILHLHGYWEQPESVILGIRSYETVLGSEHSQTVLRALAMMKTLVFVGCGAGLRDPNFGRFLAWTGGVFAGSEYRRYRLARESEREKLQAEHPPEQRLYVLSFGTRHEDLAPFLRQLVPAHRGSTQATPRVANAKQQMAVEAVREMAREIAAPPIRLLHLSDLHLTGDRSVDQLLQPLDADLRDQLKADRLDYLVVSGDLADKCNPARFERAAEFLQAVMEGFGLNASRLILVPGNHDLDRERNVYDLEINKKKAEAVPTARRIQLGDVFLIRNEAEYPKRFELFRKCYKGLTQAEYPELHDKQGLIIPYPDDGIEFLTLNSAWQIDRFRPDISINSDALSKALLNKQPNMKMRIVVWHHAVTGNRQIINPENIKRLTKAGYRICLHGDVHEERAGLLNHLDAQHSLHVVGVGSFSSADPGLQYATPRLYNLLEIDRNFASVRVRSRAQRNIDADFGPFAIYPGGDADVRRGDYWINL